MTDLREKVARALYAEAYPESPSDADACHLGWLEAADAAIRVCGEHFAGVAESIIDEPHVALMSEPPRNGCGHRVASAIREDGK